MSQELIDYIKKAREAGQSDKQIRENLLKSGWKGEDLNEFFQKHPAPIITSPKRIYNWYLITAIIYSTIAFLINVGFLLGSSGSGVERTFVAFIVTYSLVLAPQINIAWFLLNIAVLISILIKKVEKETLVLPILYILYTIANWLFFPMATLVLLIGRGSLPTIILPLLFHLIMLGIAVKLLRTKPQNIQDVNRGVKQSSNLNLNLAELFYLFVGIFMPLTNIAREVLVQVIVPNPVNIYYPTIFFSLAIFLISTIVFLAYVRPPKKDVVYLAIIGVSTVIIYSLYFIRTALVQYINW